MVLKLYNFTKKPNSTAIPSESDLAATLEVSLKDEGVSKDTPVIECSNPLIRLYDYAYFDSSWYWVRDFNFLNYQRYTVTLELDVLATYREWIMKTPNYCLRTSVASNGYVSDSLQPPDVRSYQLSKRAQFYDTDQQWYLINLSGQTGAKWYYITTGTLDTMMRQLYNQKQSELWEKVKGVDWPSISGGLLHWALSAGGGTDGTLSVSGASTSQSGDLQFAGAPGFIDLAQYVNAVVALPFAPNNLGTSEDLYYGYWQAVGCRGTTVDWIVHQGAFNIDVPHPADTGSLGSPNYKTYQRFSPYCSYSIYIPGCGTMQLDDGLVGQVDYLNVQYYVDVLGNIYGQLIIQGQPIAHFNGNCAMYMPISQFATPSLTQGLGSALSSIGTAAGGVVNLFTGNIGGAISSAGSALSSYNNVLHDTLVPDGGRMQSTGGNYALMGEPSMILTCNYKQPAAGFDYSRLGYPYYNTIIPSQGGYYLFSNARIAAGEDWENRKIESYLNGGVYIE